MISAIYPLAARRDGRRLCLQGVVLALLLVAMTALAQPPQAPTLQNLTEQEKAWLAAHPVIRVGFAPGFAPYSYFDKQGRAAGMATDMTALVASRLGVRLEIVKGWSWEQLLEGTRRREVDLLTTATYRPDRDIYLNFTDNYLNSPLVVMTRTETPRLRSLEQLNGRRVALVTRFSASEIAMERYPQMKVLPVPTPLEGLLAVSDGRAEAYIGVIGVNTYLASRNGISNLKVNTGFAPNGQAYAVRKDWPELVPLLQKALDSIPEDQKQEIFERWVTVSTDSVSLPTSKLDADALTRFEALPELRVGVLQGKPPFEFLDEKGRHSGLAADTLAALIENTGLKAKLVPGDSEATLLKRLDAGELDLVLTVNGAAPGAQVKLLSEPYLVSSLGVFVRKGDVFLGELRDLFEQRVGVNQGGYAQDTLRASPRVKLKPYRNLRESVQALLDKEVDYMVAETTSALRAIEDAGTAGVRYAGPLGEAPVRLSVAVSPRMDGLRSLIDAGLGSITPEKSAQIRRLWVGAPLQGGISPRDVWRWGTALLALVALGYLAFYLWNLRLRREIEGRKKAEASFAKAQTERDHAEQRFRHMVNSSPNALVLVDAEGCIAQATARIESMLGYRRDELIGKHVEVLLGEGLQGSHPAMRKGFFDLPAARQMGAGQELFARRKDGSELPVEITLSPLALPEGQFVLASINDVSARRDAENQLGAAHKALERHAADLASAKEKAESADRMKSSFLATMSHELRTPLNSIIGFTGILGQGLAGPVNPEQGKQLGMVQDSAKHLLKLINDVLDISKIEAGKLKVECALFDLPASIAKVVGIVTPLANEKGLALLADVAPALGEVMGNARRVEQVLLNLLNNAIKFTQQGRVVLTAEMSGDRVHIRVTDTGIGIKPEDMQTLFRAFRQIDDGLSRNHEGSGLGLAISRRLAELMGGEICAESEWGKGSTFSFTLPANAKGK